MRGADERQAILFIYRFIGDRIPTEHPLHAMRRLVGPLLVGLSPRLQRLYSTHGRPSIPPKHLLRVLLLQVLYSIRSERQLMERLDYKLLCRGSVGLTPDNSVWVPTVFTKNRARLLEGEVADAFFQAVMGLAQAHASVSADHFAVDRTPARGLGQPQELPASRRAALAVTPRSQQPQCQLPRSAKPPAAGRRDSRQRRSTGGRPNHHEPGLHRARLRDPISAPC